MKKLLVLSALAVMASGAFAKTVIKEERHYVTPIEWGLASPLQLPCTVPYRRGASGASGSTRFWRAASTSTASTEGLSA